MSPLRQAEYMEKTRTSAILDTRVASVQSVGVMSDGDRQHFPLQLWQNHWPSDQQSPGARRSTSICWRRMARSPWRRSSQVHSMWQLQAMVDIHQAKSPQGLR